MGDRTKAWLEAMNITEISLVDDPNNEEARVLIVKARGGALAGLRQELDAAEQETIEKAAGLSPTDAAYAATQETLMDIQAMQAALSEAETQITELTKAKDTAEARVTTLEAELATANDTIAKAKPALTEEEAQEAFLKSLPEAAREHFKAQAAELAEIKKARAAAEEKAGEDAEIAKAKAFVKGDEEASKVGKLLHRIRKGKTSAEDADAIEGILKSARAIDAKSPLFRPTGAAGAGEAGSAEEILKGKGEEIRKAKPALTQEQAFAEALEANPDLYQQYVQETRYGRTA